MFLIDEEIWVVIKKRQSKKRNNAKIKRTPERNAQESKQRPKKKNGTDRT